MRDNFYVYLTSNVSADTFSQDEPSQFSTILADEIHLHGQEWKVGMHNASRPC